MQRNKQYFYNCRGANGYLMKDDSDDELLVAIEKVLSGYCRPIWPKTSPMMSSPCTARTKKPFPGTDQAGKGGLQLVVKGHTSKQMAEILLLSQRTIDHHRSNLLRKFNRKNSVEMVNYAVRNGFVPRMTVMDQKGVVPRLFFPILCTAGAHPGTEFNTRLHRRRLYYSVGRSIFSAGFILCCSETVENHMHLQT